MLSPSVLNSTLVPRLLRICLVVRLIMPWRLPAWPYFTLPEAVILKRFLAPDSVLNSTLVPRLLRICLVVRLIMPWRLPAWPYFTLPEAVILKRFLAPDLVFSLGIL